MGDNYGYFCKAALGKPKEGKVNCIQARTCNPELVSEKKMICM